MCSTILIGCAHKHEWMNATCTNPKTCLSCGETEGSVLAHSWVDATCTKNQYCSECGTSGTI